MLSFKDFSDRVKNEILDFLPGGGEGYSVEETRTQKVNQGEVSMLSVRRKGEAIAASFPLEGIYQDYGKSGLDFATFFPEFASQFCGQALSVPTDIVSHANEIMDMNWEHIKHMVYVHAIGASRNEELMKTVPHKQVGDVCAVYRIHLADSPNGSATVLITDAIAERLNVSTEELHKTAVKNSEDRYPPICLRMSDMLNALDAPVPFSIDPEADELYVLTNSDKSQGAGVIFYSNVADTIYKNMPENYYLLPSSVHEWLVVSKNRADKETLEEMVRAVNESTVDPKEQLSDMVHEYDPVRKLVYAGNLPDPPKKEIMTEKTMTR